MLIVAGFTVIVVAAGLRGVVVAIGLSVCAAGLATPEEPNESACDKDKKN
jgi:hypothetical protein